jgi:hypothetical protein
MGLQPIFGPWSLFKFLDPIYSRKDSPDGAQSELIIYVNKNNGEQEEKLIRIDKVKYFYMELDVRFEVLSVVKKRNTSIVLLNVTPCSLRTCTASVFRQ